MKKFLFMLCATVAMTKIADAAMGPYEAATRAAVEHGLDPRDVVIIGNRVYYISTTGKVPYLAALTQCNDLSMSLISLETEEEATGVNAYLLEHELNKNLYWTSGRGIGDSDWMWTGTGLLFTYTNWRSGSPDVSPAHGACVYITDSDASTWDDSTSCSTSAGSAFTLCESPQVV